MRGQSKQGRSPAMPAYRLHKASGQAIVKIGGKVVYLGRWDSVESRNKYEQVVSEWRARGRYLPPGYQGPGSRLAVNDLIAAYWQHAEQYYRKGGEPTGELRWIREAMRYLHRLYGETQAADFGPLELKACREAMILKDLSRTTINGYVSRIKQCFRWGVEQALLPGNVLEALRAVRALQKGRSEAREPKPIRPVSEADMRAVLPHVSRQVAAMIELQWLTAMRPGEVVQMRTGDLDRSGRVWIYRPGRHKVEHHEMEREIQIGPKAQGVLGPFLGLDPSAPLFCPREAEVERNATRRASRRTPLWPSHAGRRRCQRRRLAEQYDVATYRRAVARGCDLAGVKRWSPNQLRHSAATWIRRELGIEAAQVVLGHRLLETTQIYAEADRARAREAMARLG